MQMMMREALVLKNDARIVFSESYAADRSVTALILHGYFSSHKSPNTQSVINFCHEQGYNTLAPDFYGCGESDGDRGEVTVAHAMDTVRACVDYVHARDPHQRIILVGSSFGGMVCLHAAKEYGDKIACVILRAPVSDWAQTWTNLITPEQFAQWDKNGSLTGRGITFGRGVLTDIRTVNVYQDIAPFVTVPVLIVHGDADEIVPYAQSEKLNTILPICDVVPVPQALHNFRSAQEFDVFRNAMKAFLQKQERLLKD